MQNEKYIKEIAEKFYSEEAALIHTEMTELGKCEICLAGSGVAMLYSVCGIINRIGEIHGQSFEETLRAINEIHNYYEGFKKAFRENLKSEESEGGEEDGEYKEI